MKHFNVFFFLLACCFASNIQGAANANINAEFLNKIHELERTLTSLCPLANRLKRKLENGKLNRQDDTIKKGVRTLEQEAKELFADFATLLNKARLTAIPVDPRYVERAKYFENRYPKIVPRNKLLNL